MSYETNFDFVRNDMAVYCEENDLSMQDVNDTCLAGVWQDYNQAIAGALLASIREHNGPAGSSMEDQARCDWYFQQDYTV